MKKTIISVIVPVFNREHTIEMCIEGICNTSYQDFEVIIVDDGSTDNTYQRCEKLEKRFSCVSLLRQNNQGVSVARNTGILHARGEYIMFVDSDDTLPPDTLNMIGNIMRGGYDIVFLGHSFAKIKGGKLVFKDECKTQTQFVVKGNVESVRWVFTEYNPYINQFYTVWAKVFKKSIIQMNHIEFRKDISLGEDQIFVCEYLKHISNLYYNNKPCYSSIVWSRNERPIGLGGMMRSPQDFLHNQLANYSALIDLYSSTKVDEVKHYAVNYILDRPITRILFRNVSWKSNYRVKYDELKIFTGTYIKEALAKEAENLKLLRNRQVAFYSKLVLSSCPFFVIYAIVFVQENIYGYFINILKRIRYFIKKVFYD